MTSPRNNNAADFAWCRWDNFAFALPLLALAPLLYLQSLFLWEKQHLQFFPLAFAAAGWFLWQGMPASPVMKWRAAFAFAFIVLVYGAVFAAVIVNSPWFAQLTLIGLIFGWALGRLGSLTPIRILAISGLLLLTVPVPFGGDQGLIRSLQSLSGTASSRILDVAGVLHLKRGNVLEIDSKPLFVEEACSGVDSQYALMAVAGVMLLIGRVGLIVSLITIVTVPLWAILGNLLRICSIVIGLDWFSVDLATGTSHTFLGLICFAVAAWLHWSSVQFLNFVECRWFHSERSSEQVPSKNLQITVDSVAVTREPPDLGMRFHVAWNALPAILLLTLPLSVGSILDHYRKDVPRINNEVAMRICGRNDLPIQLGDQVCVGFSEESRNTRNILGQHSKVWTYMDAGGPKIVSLDFPFRGWHPLWVCYEGAGWRRIDQKLVTTLPSGELLSFACYQVELENDEGEFAILHFALFDEEGLPFGEPTKEISAPSEAGYGFRRLKSNLASRLFGNSKLRDPLTFQIQLLAKTEIPATQSQKIQFLNEFLQLRQAIVTKSIPVIAELKGL